jgi:hypothetical protein
VVQRLGAGHYNTPFIDVRASLTAGDIFFQPDKKHPDSFYNDLNTMSTVLPYATWLACDDELKTLIEKTGLAHKYGVKVFSYKKDDRKRFLDTLKQLVSS